MTRKLARIVEIDALSPIPGADAIEAAHIGGWKVVVKKGEFAVGNHAVYFEIDSFLPEGNPAWQFLVDKQAREFQGVRGHVLRSIKLRGQVSQGLLLSLQALGPLEVAWPLGFDVSEHLGVVKYEPPVPAELAGLMRGQFPSVVPKTDQERIQNLAAELAAWQAQGDADELTWEITEKLEGSSCTWAWLADELHVCSRNIDLVESDSNSFWRVARACDIERKLREHFAGRNIALQGELVGNGVEGNIYKLQGHEVYLYAVYDADEARYLTPDERKVIARQLGVRHSPVIDAAFRIDSSVTMDVLLAMADGPSVLRPQQKREGLVFKANKKPPVSFKAVSNAYLLGQKG